MNKQLLIHELETVRKGLSYDQKRLLSTQKPLVRENLTLLSFFELYPNRIVEILSVLTPDKKLCKKCLERGFTGRLNGKPVFCKCLKRILTNRTTLLGVVEKGEE